MLAALAVVVAIAGGVVAAISVTQDDVNATAQKPAAIVEPAGTAASPGRRP